MKKAKKAAELIAQIAQYPEYQAFREKQERELAERAAVYRADEAAMISDLHSLGYQVESVWDFVNNKNRFGFLRKFNGRYDSAYTILVKHLSIEHHPRVREGIIRALTEKEANEAASEALLREFEREINPQLRWVLANALRTVLTEAQKRKHPEYKKVYNAKGQP
jgi:hypothetical protein